MTGQTSFPHGVRLTETTRLVAKMRRAATPVPHVGSGQLGDGATPNGRPLGPPLPVSQ